MTPKTKSGQHVRIIEKSTHQMRFDLQQLMWVTCLVAVALAFVRVGWHNHASIPDAIFFAMIVALFPVFGITKKKDPGVRFVLVGSMMVAIVINGLILAASELSYGSLEVIAWTMRLTVIAVATTLWISFTLWRG
jgi:hypothetical protein